MKKIYQIARTALLLIFMLGVVLSVDARQRVSNVEEPFRYAQKVKAQPTFGNNVTILDESRQRRAGAITPSATLVGESPYGYLIAPDGSTWYYTTENIKEQVEGGEGYYEGYVETILKGFKYTIYDSNLNKLGVVTDLVDLADDEKSIARIMLDASVTRKFFNIDDKYEVMVSVAFSTANFEMHYRTFVYSIGGSTDSEGYSIPVDTVDGYVVSSFDGATDAYSENFYFTFMTESCDYSIEDYLEFLESCKYDLKIYKKAGWGGGKTLVGELSVPQTHLPGDQMNSPFILTYGHDGSVWIAKQQYEKRYYENPMGSSDNEAPTADNSLIITLYEIMGSNLYERQVTTIPVVQETRDHDLYTYYSIGNFSYEEDINYGDFVESTEKAAFVVTKQVYASNSDDTYRTSYHVYDGEGVMLYTIMEDVVGYTRLADLQGFDTQYVFVLSDGDEGYNFSFLDFYSNNVVAVLPNNFEGFSMRGSLDRYRVGNSYMWGISVNDMVEEEDGDAFEQIIWITPDGKLDHVDKICLGKDVAYATPFINNAAMSPYLFNTDSEREYMYLVKRYMDATGSATQEELIIGSTNGETLLNLGPDATKGRLANVMLDTQSATTKLDVMYCDDDYNITQDIYEFPFVKHPSGAGTAKNPYVIEEAGDLQLIANDLTAHYVIGNSIDCSLLELQPIESGSFTGTLDGQGMNIYNLTIGSSSYATGIFGLLNEGAVIKNVIFNDVIVLPEKSAQYVGVVAGETISAELENVHVNGLTIKGECEATAGGIIGNMSLYSKIKSSSVSNALIDLPNSLVGGLVGETRTSAEITACNFQGSINGNKGVGGIVGIAGNADDAITDCHVTADIRGVNTVGGIAGSSSRAQINRCYVEGTLEAVGPEKNFSPSVGGIVGELYSNYSTPETTPIIAGCVVNVSSLIGFEFTKNPSFAGQYNRMHRIVGMSAKNEDRLLSEDAIAKNYAVSPAEVIDDTQDAVDTGVEGATIDASALTEEFFTNLGYVFGETIEAPWRTGTAADLALYYEDSDLLGVEDAALAEDTLNVVDGAINAEGCTIAVYSMSGVKVAEAVDTLALDGLARGIYVAVATANDGTSLAVKIVK